ncbi:MAG: hypothetical protein OHK93_007285 [Ramalina farinacea]|uniref:Methyltransferase domain-containing protein n=1 Tax=Ramalina farinacea TaxID=258253 RepID=A0AA43TQU6_9LECA|nr:hypothetical protein [Ramalina farinacea]
MTAFRFERSHTILLGTAIVLFLLVSFSTFDLLPSTSSVSTTSSSSHSFDGSNPKIQPHKPGQPLTIDQRMARSEASWQRYKKQQKKALKMLPPGYNGWMTDSTKDHKMYVVWDFFNPSYTCPWDMERIGQLGDGGKWVCGLSKYIEFSEMAESGEGASATSSSSSTKGLSKKTEEDGEDGDGAEEDDGKHGDKLVVYSFGVRDDSSFEEVMLSETNAEVVAVDFSVGSFGKELSPSHRNRSTFLKIGLGDADEPHHPEAPFYTLSTIMRKRKHTYIDYLKVDIEGAEWGSLGRFMDDCDDGVAGKKGGAGKKGKGKKKGGKGGKKGGEGGEDGVERSIARRGGGGGEEVEPQEKQKKSTMPVGQFSMEMHLNNDAEFGFHELFDFVERLEGFGMRCVFFEVNYWAAWEQQPKFVEMVWVNVNDERSVLWRE